MPEKTPSAVRSLITLSRHIVVMLGKIVADPVQLAALRRELDLPANPGIDTAAITRQLKDADQTLQAGQDMDDDALQASNAVLDLLMRGNKLAQTVQMIIGNDIQLDPDIISDLFFEVIGFALCEHLRHHNPLNYVFLRTLMFGYEEADRLPRLNMSAVYRRLTGADNPKALTTFDSPELASGLIVPLSTLLLNYLIAKLIPDEVKIARLKDGTKYPSGEVSYKMGWEPEPGRDLAVQNLLARSLSVTVAGKMNVKGSYNAIEFAPTFGLLHFFDADQKGQFLLRFGGNFALVVDLSAHPTVKHALEIKLDGVGFTDLLWNASGLSALPGGPNTPSMTIAYDAKGTTQVPAFRLGNGNTRMDIVTYGLGAEISGQTQSLGLTIGQGKVVIDPGEALAKEAPAAAKIFKALGAGAFEANCDGKLILDSDKGLHFKGEAGLKLRIASNLGARSSRSDGSQIASQSLDYLDLAVKLTKTGIALELTSALRFGIGPFNATIDRVGFDIDPASGHPGFIPPKAIGLKIESSGLTGGGFLSIDPEAGEFAGALELTFWGLSLKAIAILTAGKPGSAAKYAFFLLIYARWPNGLDLPLGFKLNALGGIVGINHDFDEKALIDGLPSGALDDVLFPEDPVGDAPRLIASLRKIFPVKQDAYTFGLMAEISWGSDYFCNFRLGVIVPLGAGADKNDGLLHIYILGRLKVTCFDKVPEVLRFQLICDFVGQIGLGSSGISISLYARLRDSRFGPTAIEGAIAFSLRTGPQSRLMIAAGGFHPNYKSIPEDFPTRIDRIGANYDIGVIKAWFRTYVAVVPGSLQFGAELGCEYKFGPIKFHAELGFDALIHPDPFSFEVSAHAFAALTYHDHELLAVRLDLTLWGPDRCRIKGHGEIHILFFDIDVPFDESWGDDLAVPVSSINLAPLVADDLRNPSHWKYVLPGQSDMLVTLAPRKDPATPVLDLAHPLAALSYSQSRLPFGLALQRVGASVIEGQANFPLPDIKNADGTAIAAEVTVLKGQFAIPEFLIRTDAEKLMLPAFEDWPSGIVVGAGGYSLPASVTEAQITLETRYSHDAAPTTQIGPRHLGLTFLTDFEAAARSPLRPRQSSLPDRNGARLNPSKWVRVDPQHLQAIGPEVAPTEQGSYAAVSALGGHVVEAFEMLGA